MSKENLALTINPDKIRDMLPLRQEIIEVSGDNPVYLVGGCLRDFLLGKNIYDWDFVINGDAKAFAQNLSRKTGAYFVVLDENYGIYRVIPREKNAQMDFSQCRGTIEEDLSLRDFTINSIALEIKTGKVLDPHGGVLSISNKSIKSLCQENLNSDPLRILRAYRFVSQINFTIESQTLTWIKSLAHRVIKVSWERIRDEIYKILASANSSLIFRMLYSDGILPILFPQLCQMEGLEQNSYHKYDVLNHSFYALEEMENLVRQNFLPFGKFAQNLIDYCEEFLVEGRTRLATLKLTIFLHDIGKPEVYAITDEGIPLYKGHHLTGKSQWENLAQNLKLSNREMLLGRRIIEYHLKPVFIPLEPDELKRKQETYRLFKNCQDASIGLALASWCDVEAGRGHALTKTMVKNHHNYVIELVKAYFNRECIAFPPHFVDGRDVMIMFKTTPGPMIGKVLSQIQELTAIGEIKSYEETLDYISKLVKSDILLG